MLLKSSLLFLIDRFHYIKHFQFIDASSVTCAKGVKVKFCTFYFAKYGKTWYQDKFKAKAMDRKARKAFEKANTALDEERRISRNFIPKISRGLLLI